MMMEAETRVILPTAKEGQGLPAATGASSGKKEPPLEPSKRVWP